MGNFIYYESAIGKIGIAEQDNKITNLFFEKEDAPSGEFTQKETPLLKEAAKQLQE